MSVAPRELLASAAKIRSTHSDEAGLRAAISRAYYAAHHAAFAFHVALPSVGKIGSATGRHEQLISQLSNPTFSEKNPRNIVSRRLGAILRDTLRARVIADYSIGGLVTPSDADAALLKCEEIVNTCLPPPKTSSA